MLVAVLSDAVVDDATPGADFVDALIAEKVRAASRVVFHLVAARAACTRRGPAASRRRWRAARRTAQRDAGRRSRRRPLDAAGASLDVGAAVADPGRPRSLERACTARTGCADAAARPLKTPARHWAARVGRRWRAAARACAARSEPRAAPRAVAASRRGRRARMRCAEAARRTGALESRHCTPSGDTREAPRRPCRCTRRMHSAGVR